MSNQTTTTPECHGAAGGGGTTPPDSVSCSSLVQDLRESVWARNGNFAPSDESNGGRADVVNDNHLALDNTAKLLAPLERSITRSFLKEQWELATRALVETRRKDDGVNNSTSTEHSTMAQKRQEILNTWWDRLWTMHTEPTRHYHTVVHLEEMCRYLQIIWRAVAADSSANRQNGNSTDQAVAPRVILHLPHVAQTNLIQATILLAIFFHDAIYDATSSTNEEDSAKLFQEFALELEWTRGENDGKSDTNDCTQSIIVQHVIDFILATKSHQLPETSTSSPLSYGKAGLIDALALFLDLDMAVLGKEGAAYHMYAALIRREYAFVAADIYCTKRADILDAFVHESRQLYHTDLCLDAWNDRAHDNLRREIALLRQGCIPGEHESN